MIVSAHCGRQGVLGARSTETASSRRLPGPSAAKCAGEGCRHQGPCVAWLLETAPLKNPQEIPQSSSPPALQLIVAFKDPWPQNYPIQSIFSIWPIRPRLSRV